MVLEYAACTLGAGRRNSARPACSTAETSAESGASDMSQWLQSLLGPEGAEQGGRSCEGASDENVVSFVTAAAAAVAGGCAGGAAGEGASLQLVPRRGHCKATQTTTDQDNRALNTPIIGYPLPRSELNHSRGIFPQAMCSSWRECKYDAVKRVRFDGEKIGLVIVKV
jgi:hypothetical protein